MQQQTKQQQRKGYADMRLQSSRRRKRTARLVSFGDEQPVPKPKVKQDKGPAPFHRSQDTSEHMQVTQPELGGDLEQQVELKPGSQLQESKPEPDLCAKPTPEQAQLSDPESKTGKEKPHAGNPVLEYAVSFDPRYPLGLVLDCAPTSQGLCVYVRCFADRRGPAERAIQTAAAKLAARHAESEDTPEDTAERPTDEKQKQRARARDFVLLTLDNDIVLPGRFQHTLEALAVRAAGRSCVSAASRAVC